MPFPAAATYAVADVFDVIAQTFRLDAEVLARNFGRVVGIWLLAWVAMHLVHIAARRIEAAVDDGDDSVVTLREKRGKTLSQLLRSVGRAVVLAIAVLLTFNVFINIGPILAGAGILGLAVSFGAQSLVKDVISGFFILSENQFVIGDVIEVAGKSGSVEKMTLRVVVLRDLEGTMHVIPNGEIKVVSNRTRGWGRAVIDVAVPYAEDVDRALAVVRDEAARFSMDPEWKPQLLGPLEVPGVENMTEQAVIVRVLAQTQPGAQWGVGREFRRRIKIRLDGEGIGSATPQRRVHVRLEGGGAEAIPVAAGAAGA